MFINDTIAKIPISEFMAIDKWYWDKSGDIYYPYNEVTTEAASKRGERRRNEKKDGDIWWCKFYDMENHAVRPALILHINGIKPIVCVVCSTEHRGEDWEDFPNIKIERPLKKDDHKLPNDSHVALNRYRYLKDDSIEIMSKIGETNTGNLNDIKREFIKLNVVKDKLINEYPPLSESLIDFQDLDATMEDLKDF